jgi:SOS-response transcriptional repressor LexA
MPAKPLTPDQLRETARLRSVFLAWQGRRKDEGLPYTQAWVGEALGLGQSSLSQYLAGRIPLNADAAVKFASVLGVPVEEFSPSAHAYIQSLSASTRNVSEIRENTTAYFSKRRIPLISWVQAGSWEEVVDASPPEHAEQWVEPRETRPGAHAFALTVVGDSMTATHPDMLSFPGGTTIVIDPDRGAKAGDYVVAKDVKTQKATFKRLMHDGSRWFLKPLNPAYETIEIDDPDMRVIGRVVEYIPKGGKL